MKKLFIINILLSFFFLSSFSQSQKAIEILDELSSIYQSYGNAELKLLGKVGNETDGFNQSFVAKLILQKDKSRLEFGDQQIINNGKTTWVLMKDAEEVMVYNADESDVMTTPTKFLKNYKEDYDVNFIEEISGFQFIELIPKETTQFSKIKLKIIKDKKEIKRIEFFDNNGTIYRYVVTWFSTNNKDISDKTFIFQQNNYPNFEVIDMR